MKTRILLCFIVCLKFVLAENVLNVAINANVGPMNPHAYSPNAMFAQNMIYEGLVKFSDDGQILPSIASSWTVSKDGKIYTFIINDAIKFSNGEDCDAYAVEKNFLAILKNRKRHAWVELANLIESVRAISPSVFELRLKSPYLPTLYELSLIRPFRFVAPSSIPNDFDTLNTNPKPIGTGPFVLKESSLGVYDVFVKNPFYRKKVFFDKIVAKIIPEPTTRLLAIKVGDVDLIYGEDLLSIEMIREAQKSKKLQGLVGDPIYTTSIVLNSTHPVLKEKSVREAIAYAIDKKSIVDSVYYGMQGVANSIFSPQMPFCDLLDKKSLIFDLQTSRAKLAQYQGKDTSELEFILDYIGNNPTQKAMAEIIQAQLGRVGINIVLRANELTIFQKRQNSGAFELIFSDTWGSPYEPFTLLGAMRTATHHVDYQAQMGLPNKGEIDEQISNLLTTTSIGRDLSKRIYQVLETIEESFVYIPLTYQLNRAVASKSLKGVKMGIKAYEIPFEDFYRD